MLAKRTKRKRSLVAAGVWMVAVLTVALCVGQARADAPDEDAVQDALSVQSIQTFHFKEDMTLKKALKQLSVQFQKNIVPSEKVNIDGRITVRDLYEVTFEEALEAVLGSNKYEFKGNFIKVYTDEEFMQDKSRFEHVTITLYYINSKEAEQLATPLLSEFGELGTTTPADTDMEAGKGGDTLAVHDRLVVKDYPENLERIRKVLAEVDVEPQQVLLEVTIMKAQLTEDTEVGIDWTTIPGFEAVGDVPGFDGDLSNGGVDFQGGLLSIGISIDDITGLITASEEVEDLSILANPKILALNKQAGKLIIGLKEGYRESVTVSGSGIASDGKVEFLESGTILEFRPFIGRDGLIRMEIKPEQSASFFTGPNLDIPNKSTTNIITNVLVKDGQTIVLGGLFQEETTLNRGQVPVLGDVPVVGELFKRTGDRSVRTELVVLITPHIINTPEEADGADRLEDVLRMNSEARGNLYWLSRAKIDESRYAKAVKLYTEGQPEAALALLNSPLNIKRNYLEEVRLKERIIKETQPDQFDTIERIMLETIQAEDSDKWFRR